MKIMTVRALAGAGLLLLLLPPVSEAQDTTPFEGRWVIIRERCVPPQQSGQPTVQSGVPNRIDIEVEADTLAISVRKELRGGALQRYTDTVIIDGEPHPFDHEGGQGTLTAKWEGTNLVLIRRTEMQMQGRTMAMEQEESWQVGELEDGSPVLAILVQPPTRAGAPGAGGMPSGRMPPSGRTGGRAGGRGGGGSRPGGTATVLAYAKRR